MSVLDAPNPVMWVVTYQRHQSGDPVRSARDPGREGDDGFTDIEAMLRHVGITAQFGAGAAGSRGRGKSNQEGSGRSAPRMLSMTPAMLNGRRILQHIER
jgi:hypothetical protein